MGKLTRVWLTAVLLIGSPAAHADDHDMMAHRQHMAAATADGRQPVGFPPEMREHVLSNMRDHLKAVSEILAAMSSGSYAEAAHIASTRLGMSSPAAEGCKLPEKTSGRLPESRPMNTEYVMALFMPEEMRNAGLAMHQAASNFAGEADNAGKTGDAKPAYTALARVTQQCTACHAAYRLQ